jgi:GntR family transcriptional regulator, transcriptional repressor for pyruvate dehydrogenase complex
VNGPARGGKSDNGPGGTEKSRSALPRGVAREIEGWVRSGRFPPGGRLPPERELAVRMDTSRNVLREALRILETRGVVKVRHGIGTFVADDLAVEEHVIPVAVHLEASQLPVEEVLVARRVIECAVAELAARARDDFDLEELSKMVEITAEAEKARDMERFVEADIRFHEFLGQCTHNSLLAEVQSEMTRASSAVRGLASQTYDAMRVAVRFHREILEACVRRDDQAARAVMLLHLIDAGERLLGALSDPATEDGQPDAAGGRTTAPKPGRRPTRSAEPTDRGKPAR